MPQHSGTVTAYETRTSRPEDERQWSMHMLTIGGQKMSSFEKLTVDALIAAMGSSTVFTIDYSQNDKGYKTIEGVTEGGAVAPPQPSSVPAPTNTGDGLSRIELLRIAALTLSVEATASIGQAPGQLDGAEANVGDNIDAWMAYFQRRITGKATSAPQLPPQPTESADSNAGPLVVELPAESEPMPVAGTQPEWMPEDSKHWGEWVKAHNINTTGLRMALGNLPLTDWLEADASRTVQGAAGVVWVGHAGVEVESFAVPDEVQA